MLRGEKNLSARSFVTFVLVGGFATALHYLLTAFFVFEHWLPFVQASALGFTLSAITNYLLNAKLTFRGDHNHAVAATRFVITAGMGLAINVAALLLFGLLRIPPIPAQLLATGIVLIWNYTISAVWTFKSKAK